MSASLSILGVGVYLPPARLVREVAAEAGGDVSGYEGWDHVSLARPEDHPGVMAAQALEPALREAGISPSALKLVVSAGVSRDYPPSWSVAAEVMKLHRIPASCLGLDISVGCVGSLAALNLILGWLAMEGGGYAAVVNAERWSHTIDRSNTSSQRIWGHGDAASAMIVGLGATAGSLASFRGATFASHSDFNGHLLVKYGGTRYPVAPPGENPYSRQLGPTPGKRVWEIYQAGYSHAFREFTNRFQVQAHRLVCNQVSPKIVQMISEVAGVPKERTVWTGHETGHIGGTDVVLGLRRLIDAKQIDGPIAVAGSVPYAFGAALLLPPQ